MTEGEPPDETGESAETGRSRDGDAASDDADGGDDESVTDEERDNGETGASDTGDGETGASDTGDGETGASDTGDDAVDPAAEVEAAVEEALGPHVLDKSDGPADDADDGDDEDSDRDGDSDSDGETVAVASADAAEDGPTEDGTAAATTTQGDDASESGAAPEDETTQQPVENVPADVRKYDRFKKIDGGTYDRANEFLRDRTYITAREWAMARLCADFRTETGVEMTKIGNNLPELVPFMTDTYTPQAVNQARAAFEEKVRKAGATFLYGAMCDFFTAEELDDVMYESTEVAKFLLEVEGVELSVDEELAAEDHISEVMRDVREHSAALRHDEVTCPECGHEIDADG